MTAAALLLAWMGLAWFAWAVIRVGTRALR